MVLHVHDMLLFLAPTDVLIFLTEMLLQQSMP